ncbi:MULTISPECIES: hypothetical protein [Candidatus Cardinium]|uniref:hypothetical protein n=1 Tax=Candidatus Cardinium TaxID=273135 RepID=UPI001FAAF91A|nr:MULTISPECIES: hypothetical protein [Cardinium]
MYHTIKAIPIKSFSLVFLLYIELVISGCTSRLRLNAVRDDSVCYSCQEPALGYTPTKDHRFFVDALSKGFIFEKICSNDDSVCYSCQEPELGYKPTEGYHFYLDACSKGFIFEEIYSNIALLFKAFDERVLCFDEIGIDLETYKRFQELRKENLAKCYSLTQNCSKHIYRSMLLSAIEASCLPVVVCLLNNEFATSFFGPLSLYKTSYADTLSQPYTDDSELEPTKKLKYHFLHKAVSIIKELNRKGSDTSSALKVFYSLMLAEKNPCKQDTLLKENIVHLFVRDDNNNDNHDKVLSEYIMSIFKYLPLTIKQKNSMLTAKDSQGKTPEQVARQHGFTYTAKLLNKYCHEYDKKLLSTPQDGDTDTMFCGKPDAFKNSSKKRKRIPNHCLSYNKIIRDQAQIKSMGKKIDKNGLMLKKQKTKQTR